MNAPSTAAPGAEPQPGQWLPETDFAHIVRLTPLISLDLIVRSPENRILLGHRTNEPARDCWFVPGGRVTKNETVAAAFRRLTRDELGVEQALEQARFLGVYEHFYPTNRFEQPGYGTHYVVLGFELRASIGPETLPHDQHRDYVWKTEAELLTWPQVHENSKAYFQDNTPGQRPRARVV
jgi:colanic acid biosynthesis protein WcaH